MGVKIYKAGKNWDIPCFRYRAPENNWAKILHNCCQAPCYPMYEIEMEDGSWKRIYKEKEIVRK